jgi:16S rRNA (cytidine1402-2'-O)-methyltransferase
LVNNLNTGVLYVVATPIGNLADITLRALEILKSVDLIAAEDTRHSQILLNHYGIHKPLISLHQHNEQQRISELLPKLRAGQKIALISDAGTPLISDPGAGIVRTLHQEKIPVVPIPGPCAAVSALAVSGLSADRFLFEGFLPTQESKRKQRLAELVGDSRTIVFYESPHRMEDLLRQLMEIFGEERMATLVREMTKNFETIRQDTLKNLRDLLQKDPNQRKGEFVLTVEGAPEHKKEADESEWRRILGILLAELPLKQAVSLTVQITHAKRNRIYELALKAASSEST